MRFSIVDVFAEAPLQGNQLAVVEDAAALTTERMQDIAREMNFSETTFVLERTNERAKVRIFTPGHELPFAGHPTLGTAWVLGRDQGSYILDLSVGPVQVSFDVSDIEGDEGGGICWMAPPMPEVTGKIDPADAAKLLNLKPDDLDANYPATQIQVGPQFGFVGVRDETVLKNIRLNTDVREQLMARGLTVSSVFIFCATPESRFATDFAARLFFDAGGMREDPATGSANSAFAVYLRDLCGEMRTNLVVAQGDYINRPSRIYLELSPDHYRVGGRVQSVAVGELNDYI